MFKVSKSVIFSSHSLLFLIEAHRGIAFSSNELKKLLWSVHGAMIIIEKKKQKNKK